MDLSTTPEGGRHESPHLRAAAAASTAARHGVYLGHDAHGWCFAPPEHSVMVLGPPRSGKTSALVVPNLLAATGAVVSTSTKPDVLDATVAARSSLGRCRLFDPTGTAGPEHRVERLRWSPLQSCRTWDGAASCARSLVTVAAGLAGSGAARPEGDHWNERARALLGPLLHAAALDGASMATVLAWVDRRQLLPARRILACARGGGSELAADLLDGIGATDERELSGIWSTASGALAGFRTERALAATVDPDFDALAFAASSDTVYVSAPAHRQALVAPMVVGLVEDVRTAAYERAARSPAGRPAGPPLLLALDEVANIAPLPELPSMISEGGGQGVVTLACFQDLAQARHRWPGRADGFPSLFGTTVVLPGIGDVRTLEALATLAGDEEVPVRTVSAGRSPTGHLADLATGGRVHHGETATTQWRRRLPADVITRGAPGHALVFDERNRAAWVPLAPAHGAEPWRSIVGAGRTRRRDRHEVTGPARER